LNSSGYGLAAVELVRAAVYYQGGRLSEAALHAERAEHAYAHLGQERRRMKAVYLRGSINLELLNLEAAASLYQQVVDYGEELNDTEWIAKGSYGRANSELDRGNLGEASLLFLKALVILREDGPASDRISTEWGLARVILHGGNASEAVRRLRDVMAAFENLGMVSDAALAGIDLSDALLTLDRPREIVKVAEHSFRVLKKAGVLTGALMALAYLKEAAANSRLEPALIKSIRNFMRRAARDPELVFVPPPDISD
jgi:tetratricopeptide (TPR) repeat protein